ncbi:MAG TPA: hypothetical protein VFS92_02495, partial [Planctomycetota bacterium]|nr:hypothetical protein [Planctomycetota bacterium]
MDLPGDADNPFLDDSDPFAGPPDPRLPDPAEKAPQTAQEPPSATPPAALPDPSETHDPTPEEVRLAFDRANEASTPPAPQTNGAKGRKKGAPAKPPEEPAVRLAPQDLAAEAGVLGSIVL